MSMKEMDSSADVHQRAADRQVPALHVSDEYSHDRAGRGDHQSQFPDAKDTQDAALGSNGLPRRPAATTAHEAASSRRPMCGRQDIQPS